jgi:hypothetical protein
VRPTVDGGEWGASAGAEEAEPGIEPRFIVVDEAIHLPVDAVHLVGLPSQADEEEVSHHVKTPVLELNEGGFTGDAVPELNEGRPLGKRCWSSTREGSLEVEWRIRRLGRCCPLYIQGRGSRP